MKGIGIIKVNGLKVHFPGEIKIPIPIIPEIAAEAPAKIASGEYSKIGIKAVKHPKMPAIR